MNYFVPMNSLYNRQDLDGIINRLNQLTPASERKWGKMNVSQMLAHCNKSMETALGENKINRLFIGRIITPFIRKLVLGEKPFAKNSPTDKTYIFKGEHDFELERSKTISIVNRFHEAGPSGCTTHPHPFFGHFSPEEWAVFQWKHLDHHLRQFGA